MPQRLGEDPLTRHRKGVNQAARDSSNVGTPGPLTVGPFISSSPPQGTDTSTSSLEAMSYNDVFFRKRSDDAMASPSAGQTSMAEPEPSATANPPAPMKEGTADEQIKTAPPEVPPAPAPPAETTTADARTEPQPASRELHEAGLLRRIFGRFRK